MKRKQAQSSLSDENAFLLELFRNHGIDVAPVGDWIVFRDRNMRAKAAIVREMKQQVGMSVQLDVRIEIEPGRTIIESFAGVGESKDRAVANAQHNFVVNSFHVILAAFFMPEDEQVTREEWIIGGQRKLVTIGSIGMRGELLVQGEQAAAWFRQFKERLQAKRLEPRTYWVRLYYGQMQREAIACEVLLDNEPWEEMRSEMASIAWPVGEAFYSIRVFLVIQDFRAET